MTPRFAKQFRSDLTEIEDRLLEQAASEVVDGLFEDLAELALYLGSERIVPFQDLIAGMRQVSRLPRQYTAWYGPEFQRAFIVCSSAVGLRLLSGAPRPLLCTADELALYLFISEARDFVEVMAEHDPKTLSGVDPGSVYSEFVSVAYDDLDFLALYRWHEGLIEQRSRESKFPDLYQPIESWFSPFYDGILGEPPPYVRYVPLVPRDLIRGHRIPPDP